VHSSAGLKAIEQVEVGDRVWAFDHKRMRWAEREVVEAYRLLHRGTMATIQVRGETLRSTGGHPFWVVQGEGLADRPPTGQILPYEAGSLQEGRWVLARDLCAGDWVLLRDCQAVTLESVSVDTVEETVYNFTVAELQNYAVGTCGALVHNTNTGPTPRPDLPALSGGRSGTLVKTLKGPPNSAIKGAEGRVYVTNDRGEVIFDITKERVKPVYPGRGFGPKRPPTPQELDLIKQLHGDS